MRWVGVIVCFFLLADCTFAATSVRVVSAPPSVDEKGQIDLDIALTCTGCSDSYLRGVLYSEGTKYFGFTQNKSGVYTNVSASKCTEYFKIASDDLVEGTWSGRLVMQPDRQSSFYTGPGEYFLKVGRYTGSCGTPTWSSEVTLTITGPTPTPTPSPTPAPTAAPTATSTPTTTPTPASISTPTPSVRRFFSPTPQADTMMGTTEDVGSVSAVLGLSAFSSPSGSYSSSLERSHPWRAFSVAAAFVSLGCALLSGVFAWIKRNDILVS